MSFESPGYEPAGYEPTGYEPSMIAVPDGTDPPHHPDPDETVFTEA